jgi:hypothetical protein
MRALVIRPKKFYQKFANHSSAEESGRKLILAN